MVHDEQPLKLMTNSQKSLGCNPSPAPGPEPAEPLPFSVTGVPLTVGLPGAAREMLSLHQPWMLL